MDPLEARKLLWNVDEGLQFSFQNGRYARNLKELLAGVSSLKKEEYEHHVYFDHNDFSNWLLDVLGDDKLARDLFGAHQEQAIALLKGRVHYLEHQAKQR